MVEKILARLNLEQAYLFIINRLTLEGKASYYRGWDSLGLSDAEATSSEIISQVQEELRLQKAISPAILLQIPKSSNPQKLRDIYIYNLKDRIKAQAIYQVVEPYFNNHFSPWLFSYRQSHPSYYAARSTVRHYRKYFSRDYVFTTDLSDYSNYILPDQLRIKIQQLDLPTKVNELLALFIGNPIIKQGKIIYPQVGLVQGVPLIALFNNLYLNDFDKYCGRRADFYRRVGDDLIIFDQKLERLDLLKKHFQQTVADLGLKVNQQKSQLASAQTKFNFLGYSFYQGEVSMSASFYRSKINNWRQQFPYRQYQSKQQKTSFLLKTLNRRSPSLSEQFRQIAEQKKLVTDEKQVRQLSEDFFRILTRYFFGQHTPRHRRLLEKQLKKLRLVSLYKHFFYYRHVNKKTTN